MQPNDSYIIDVGVDIESVYAVKKAMKETPAFVTKTFFPEEIEFCKKTKEPEQRFAARWAAKEAIIKACSDVQELMFDNIKITRKESGKPYVEFLDSEDVKTEKLKDYKVLLSMSHTAEQAIAFAVLTKKPE